MLGAVQPRPIAFASTIDVNGKVNLSPYSFFNVFSANPPANVNNVAEMIDSALATALHAARSAIHRTLGVSPGGLVFRRDMFLDIPLLTDFQVIQERRQVTIDKNLCHANSRR